MNTAHRFTYLRHRHRVGPLAAVPAHRGWNFGLKHAQASNQHTDRSWRAFSMQLCIPTCQNGLLSAARCFYVWQSCRCIYALSWTARGRSVVTETGSDW